MNDFSNVQRQDDRYPHNQNVMIILRLELNIQDI